MLIPRDNESDLYEVDAEVKERVHFIPVGSLSGCSSMRWCAPRRTHARLPAACRRQPPSLPMKSPADAHKGACCGDVNAALYTL